MYLPKALGFEDAVRKCTEMTAQHMGPMDRGLLRQGIWAYIIVWDPDGIRNNASFTAPRVYPSGIRSLR